MGIGRPGSIIFLQSSEGGDDTLKDSAGEWVSEPSRVKKRVLDFKQRAFRY